ncbi:membrane-spanning 4-domain, subfamily A, member 17C.1 [Pimephales promelas]|nr:membrane-spanning 4-domain, subfamily A, member 17C.1 [Pimephales promelas]
MDTGEVKDTVIRLKTVQVMIGVVVFFLGVLLTLNDYNYPAILVYSGITYWGSCIFIIAGSLSVAAQDKRHPSVVKASLGMNVFSAVTAGLAIPLMSVQLAVISMMDPSLYAEGRSLQIKRRGQARTLTSPGSSEAQSCMENSHSSVFKAEAQLFPSPRLHCFLLSGSERERTVDIEGRREQERKRYFSLRIVGIMLVFTVPQFIISICVSAFACKASYNTHSTLVNVALNQGH